jgi:hypothetical protein
MKDVAKIAVLLVTPLVAGACGGEEEMMSEATDMASEPVEEVVDAPAQTGRVFFEYPQDGAEISVDVPLTFEFGSEDFEISPVPEEVETPRADMGHYHLGVNAECLPVGEVIPQSDPWIHFGDGSNTIEMALEPGTYQFSVQAGDDDHRTLEGLCETISIELADGI